MTTDQLLAELRAMLVARKERKMSDYKLVPVEPTAEMIEAAREHHEGEAYLPVSVYKAMLAAAPAAQGEPVGWQFYQHGEWCNGDDTIKGHRKTTEEAGFRVRDVYAAPQPAEQKPSAGDSLTPVPDEVFAAEFAAWWEEHGQFCRAGGGTYEQSFAFEAWRHLYPQLMNLQMAAAEQQPPPDPIGWIGSGELNRLRRRRVCAVIYAEKQAGGFAPLFLGSTERPAPDVEALVEALESALGSFDDWCEGQDPSDIADAIDTFPWVMQARAALAAHRKGGDV